MIASFRSKALRRLWTRNDPSGVRPDWLPRVRLVLSTLDRATRPEDLDLPGLGLHRLTGDRKGRYAVSISRNWRITFDWDGDDATKVDLENYHG